MVHGLQLVKFRHLIWQDSVCVDLQDNSVKLLKKDLAETTYNKVGQNLAAR